MNSADGKKIMLLLVGLPGSGKSTIASKLVSDGWKRINWDDLRKEMPGYTPGKFNKNRERDMQKYSHRLAREAAIAGYNIVIDNTNLNPKTRNEWAVLAEEIGVQIQIQLMSSSVPECIERDRERSGDARVGRAVIERMALKNGMLKFLPADRIVIVDMDGTLSDSSKRLQFVTKICEKCNGTKYTWREIEMMDEGRGILHVVCDCCNGTGKGKNDWASFFSKVGEDEVNPIVEGFVRALYKAGMVILIVSGRPIDKAGIITEDWLDRKGIPYQHLFMRNSGDKRDDIIVKKEILDRLPKNQIFCAFDDRPSVIRMWRANGIKMVVDVGLGEEF